MSHIFFIARARNIKKQSDDSTQRPAPSNCHHQHVIMCVESFYLTKQSKYSIGTDENNSTYKKLVSKETYKMRFTFAKQLSFSASLCMFVHHASSLISSLHILFSILIIYICIFASILLRHIHFVYVLKRKKKKWLKNSANIPYSIERTGNA